MCVECENAHAERIFFSLACGESVLQSALIFSEEVRCCKWKLSIGFIYPLFFFPSHLLLSLPLFFFSVQSVLPPPIFPPSAVFVPLYLHLFPSLPLFRSFIFFCLFCVSFPFCRCPTLTLSLPPHTLSLSLPVSICFSLSLLCLVFFCPLQPAPARQTGQYICIAEHGSPSPPLCPAKNAGDLFASPPSSPPRSPSSFRELPSTGCSRIIESSMDRMGNIDSLHCSILSLLSTTPPLPSLPPHLFLHPSLLPSLRLSLSFCLPASRSFSCDHKL